MFGMNMMENAYQPKLSILLQLGGGGGGGGEILVLLCFLEGWQVNHVIPYESCYIALQFCLCSKRLELAQNLKDLYGVIRA